MKKIFVLLSIVLSIDAQKRIIVDVSTVFLKENMLEFVKHVGFKKLASYTMHHFKSPADGCLDFLDRISQEPDEQSEKNMKYRNRRMPKCMVDWHTGEISYQALVQKLKQHNQTLLSNGYFARAQDKEFFDELITVALDPQHAHEIIKLSPGTLNLIKEIKQHNCSLYGVANMAPETFAALKKKHTEFFDAFDDIIISGQIKSILPEQDVYSQIFKKHGIQKEHCLYIEGSKEYVKEVQKTGLKVAHCCNARAMRNHLKKYGYLG